MCFHSILLFRDNPSRTKGIARYIYVWYSLAMVVLLAFALMANLLLGQFMWIEHRNFPGGPVAYFNDESTIWFNVLGSAADVVADYLSNALLVNIFLNIVRHILMLFIDLSLLHHLEQAVEDYSFPMPGIPRCIW